MIRTPHKAGALTLSQTGPAALLQNAGRHKIQHIGFCESGAADEHAFFWANTLLANALNQCALEITLGPFECTFDKDTRIAITGAADTITLNKQAVLPWSSVKIKAGDQLHIAPPKTGVRSYLAVDNGFLFDDPLTQEGAMVPREKSGPFGGEVFSKQQQIRYPLATKHKTVASRATPRRFIPDYTQPLLLEVMLSYQHEQFSEEAQEQLWRSEYIVHQDSNRMACTLSGPAINYDHRSLLSEGIALGAIQIPASGIPIILLKDRQTIGGYPKIGCVSRIGCSALSQRRPGQKVRFQASSVEDNQTRLRAFTDFFSLAHV